MVYKWETTRVCVLMLVLCLVEALGRSCNVDVLVMLDCTSQQVRMFVSSNNKMNINVSSEMVISLSLSISIRISISININISVISTTISS